jgi:hypothetical protein
MSLENLVRTNQLQPHDADLAAVQRLLAAAERNLADARVPDISDETRFDAAYRTIMQCAMAGLHANGYRPATSTPGHHQTMIQTLTLTLGVPREDWIVLDALRRKRNVADYSGELIETASVTECIERADGLLRITRAWLRANRPDLLG